MRDLIRKSFVNSLSIFAVSLFMSGLVVSGGFASYLYAGILLTVFITILDPIIKVVTLPFTILTLGLLSFLSTLAALIVLTLVYNNISVTAFNFQSLAFLGGSISNVQFSQTLSYVVISATIHASGKIIDFIFSK